MRILVVKTSSMGDVIHTLPAITDALRANPDLQIDWVIEKPFAEIPLLHPGVQRVIPVRMREWRKNWLKTLFSQEWREFKEAMTEYSYDKILDAQGLLKSAYLSRFARGPRYGLDYRSAWESAASFLYQKKIAVDPTQHAIVRVRELFAKALGYELPDLNKIEYGIRRDRFAMIPTPKPYCVFLHGTTWVTKHYPEQYWDALCERMRDTSYQIRLPWSTDMERQRAESLAKKYAFVEVLPKSTLTELAYVLANAKAVVSVDTGLGHLTAALGVPCVSLYGPTQPEEIGTKGEHQVHCKADVLCDVRCTQRHCALPGAVTPACFEPLTVDKVFLALQPFL